VNDLGEVVVIDTLAGEVRTRYELDAELASQMSSLRVWSDGDTWYIHVGHSVEQPTSVRYESASTELQLPSVTVHGSLIAVDREDGRERWREVFQKRTMLTAAGRDLPFLVTFSRVQEGTGTNASRLLLELVDKRTGTAVARRTDIDRQRIVHLEHHRPAGCFTIFGAASQILVHYVELPDEPDVLALP
jgi:hypothetical protein